VRPDLDVTPENLETIARICTRLDGLPLAIELAAARSKLLSPRAIVSRLDRRLPLLTWGPSDAPERHQALRATIAWSYDLLDIESQRLFRRLAVFAGGFTLQAATAVPAFDHAPPSEIDLLDRIALLVDRSVLIRDDEDHGEPRFRMLETLREFGIEQLVAYGEREATEWAHLAWCADLVRRAEPELIGSRQRTWFALLDQELPNIRQALEFAVERNSLAGLEMTGALSRFWDHRHHLAEGLHWFGAVLGMTGDFPPEPRGKALWGHGVLAFTAGDYAGAEAILREGVAASRAAGDRYHHAFSVNDLGSVALRTGNLANAQALFQESLELMRDMDDGDGIAAVLGNLAYAAFHAGNWDQAIRHGNASLEIYRDIGSDQGQASMLITLGRSLVPADALEEAETSLLDGLDMSIALDKYAYVALSLDGLAAVAIARHDFVRGGRILGALDEFVEATSAALAPIDQSSREQHLAQVRESLGPGEFAAAIAGGRGLSPRDVLDEANVRRRRPAQSSA
jgi:tetratricopeptide (TPR) repeat protein